MVSRTTFWEAILAIGAGAVVSGLVILATNGDVVDHGYGIGLIVVGGLLVIVALVVLFLPWRSTDDQKHIRLPGSESSPLIPQALDTKPEAQPNLEIVIGAGPPFRQERCFVWEGLPTKQTLCRVGIRHDGDTTVDNVSVEVESMKPHSLPVPLLLHQMNDNPPTGQFKQEFSLDAGQTKHVDVVLKQDDDDEQPTRNRVLLLRRARGVLSRLLIFHIVPDVSQDIPVERHEVVILAHGHDAKPLRQNFIIDVDDDGALQFQAATSPS